VLFKKADMSIDFDIRNYLLEDELVFIGKKVTGMAISFKIGKASKKMRMFYGLIKTK
jgi:hypothetical protein